MTQDIVGSKQKTFASEQLQPSNRGYGQNGWGGSSSQTPGEARKISKTYASIATPDVNISATAGESFQTRSVSSKQAVPTNPGTRGASKGGTVPLSTVRRANDGLFRNTR